MASRASRWVGTADSEGEGRNQEAWSPHCGPLRISLSTAWKRSSQEVRSQSQSAGSRSASYATFGGRRVSQHGGLENAFTPRIHGTDSNRAIGGMGETPLEAQGGYSGTSCGTGEGLGCPRISEGDAQQCGPPSRSCASHSKCDQGRGERPRKAMEGKDMTMETADTKGVGDH